MKYKSNPKCHPYRKLKGRGLCNACYLKVYRRGELEIHSRIDYNSSPPIMAKCHTDRIHVAQGLCNACYHKTRYKSHRKVKKPICHPEARYGANGLCKFCYSRQYRLKTVYGITPEEYTRLLILQNNVCAICKQPERTKRLEKHADLCIDHDHLTGKVRGLLCLRCNVILGHIEDPIVLQRSLNYLSEHKNREA